MIKVEMSFIFGLFACACFFLLGSESFREGVKDQQLVASSMQNMLKTHQRTGDSLFEAKQRLSQLQDKKAAIEVR